MNPSDTTVDASTEDDTVPDDEHDSEPLCDPADSLTEATSSDVLRNSGIKEGGPAGGARESRMVPVSAFGSPIGVLCSRIYGNVCVRAVGGETRSADVLVANSGRFSTTDSTPNFVFFRLGVRDVFTGVFATEELTRWPEGAAVCRGVLSSGDVSLERGNRSLGLSFSMVVIVNGVRVPALNARRRLVLPRSEPDEEAIGTVGPVDISGGMVTV